MKLLITDQKSVVLIYFKYLAYSVFLLVFCSNSYAEKASGMVGASVAIADDPTAILHNPAGLSQLNGTQLYVGVTAINLDSKYTNTSGQTEVTDFQIFNVPHFYLTSDFEQKNIVFGVGFYSPFGIGGRKWSRTGLTRYLSTDTYTATFAANPAISWMVTDDLSVAGGLVYMKAINKGEAILDQSLLGASDGRINLDSSGSGWGMNLGLLYRLDNQWKVGFSYRSAIKVDSKGNVKITNLAPAVQPLFGGSTFKTNVSSSATFPEMYLFGLSGFLNDQWTVAFDIDLIKWSVFKDSNLDYEQEVPAAGFTDMRIPLDWKDIWKYKIGIDYKLNEIYSIRGGYAYIDTYVPDQTLEPSNPDSIQHNWSVGFSYHKKNWVVDAYYFLGLYDKRSVSNDLMDGEYRNTVKVFGLSFGYNY